MFKVIGKIIKYGFIALIVAVNAVILWRMFSSGDPSSMKKLLWNENTAVAYEKSGSALEIIKQKEYKNLTADGKFYFSNMRYIPEAKQMQITVRYNRSTLEKLAADYSLSGIPEKDANVFEFTLIDNNGNRYYSSAETYDTKTVYIYRRYIFDGVELDGVESINLNVYYNENIEYDNAPYGELLVYHKDIPTERYKLGSADIKGYKKFKSAASN